MLGWLGWQGTLCRPARRSIIVACGDPIVPTEDRWLPVGRSRLLQIFEQRFLYGHYVAEIVFHLRGFRCVGRFVSDAILKP